MRRPLALLLALAGPLTASVAPAAEDPLVIYTAYEENELSVRIVLDGLTKRFGAAVAVDGLSPCA